MILLPFALALLAAGIALLWVRRRHRRRKIADIVRLDRRLHELPPPTWRPPHAPTTRVRNRHPFTHYDRPC